MQGGVVLFERDSLRHHPNILGSRVASVVERFSDAEWNRKRLSCRFKVNVKRIDMVLMYVCGIPWCSVAGGVAKVVGERTRVGIKRRRTWG